MLLMTYSLSKLAFIFNYILPLKIGCFAGSFFSPTLFPHPAPPFKTDRV